MARLLEPDQVTGMLEAARVARERAHAPYSSFHVGAAVLDEQGRIHAGCNVENAAYPLGTCAEANALASFVLAGGKRVEAILVLGEGERLVAPCGGCRQRMREFADSDTPILVADPQRVREQFTLGQLLPHSFGPENLEK